MTPSEVADACNLNFGLEIARQSIEFYDPEKAAGGKLDEELKQVFYRTRKQFISDMLSVDIAHRVFRLRELSKLYHRAVAEGKDVLAAQFLEQAAKEVGGFYVNRFELRIKESLAALMGVPT